MNPADSRAACHAAGAGPRRLFIYYRVQPGRADAAIAAAARMQASLRERHPGLDATLHCRHPAESQVTLMETYAVDAAVSPPGIGEALAAEIEAAAACLSSFIDGARHVEVFEVCC